MPIIRNVQVSEYDDLLALLEFAFQFQLPADEKEKERAAFQSEQYWGLYEHSGRLLSNLRLIPIAVWIHGRKFETGGVGAVCSWPDARRQGGVAQLLRHSLERMRENGQTISMLHPFSVPFYRKYGYELTITRKKYTMEKKYWPEPRRDIPGAVEIVPKQVKLLSRVYEAYASRYSGPVARDADWWERKLFTKKGLAALYRNGDGEPEGYMLYQVADRKMQVHEWVHTTETARSALWNYVWNHDSMAEEVTMFAPEDDALALLLPEPRFKQEVLPYFMSRIVDVQNFLRKYPFLDSEREDKLALRVEDPLAPWNEGWLRLTWPAGGGAVDVTEMNGPADKLPSVSCDIQTLTALLAGGRRPALLAEVGRLNGDANVIGMLERRVPTGTTYLLDFF